MMTALQLRSRPKNRVARQSARRMACDESISYFCIREFQMRPDAELARGTMIRF